MRYLICVALLVIISQTAFAGQVTSPVNAPTSIAPGHVYGAGSSAQQAIDGGVSTNSIVDYGAVAGAQKICTVTTNSASTTLTVSGCGFTSAVCHSGAGCTGTGDNLITIDGAGSTSTTTYYGTVTGFTGSTQVTLGAMPGQTLAAQAKSVSWGPDNAGAILATDNAAVASGGFGRIYVPAGVWLTSGPMTLNPSVKQTMIYGAGIDKSVIVAGAAMSSVLFEGTSFVRGGEVADMTFDGNRLTTNVAFLSCAQRNLIHNVNFYNAAPLGTNIVLGDGVTAGCNSSSLLDVNARNDSSRYSGGSDLPNGLVLINESDSWWTNFFGSNASQTGVTVASSATNTHLTAPHVFGSAAGYNPATAYQVNASAFLEQVNVDGVKTTGVDINSSNVTLTDGTLILPENASTVVGVQIEASSNNVTVKGWNASDALNVAANRLVINSPIAANVFAYGNPGANDYNPLPVYPLNDTTSLKIGVGALASATSTSNTVAVGRNGCFTIITAASDTCIGASAGFHALAGNNFFGGAFSGFNVTSGNAETITGVGAAQSGASFITGNDISLYGNNTGKLLAGASANLSFFGSKVGSVNCLTPSNVLLIGTSGSTDCASNGEANAIHVGAGSTDILTVTGTNVPGTSFSAFAGTLGSLVTTVSALPSCVTGIKGARAAVTDANSPTYLGALTGGSSTFTPVVCNGGAWVPG